LCSSYKGKRNGLRGQQECQIGRERREDDETEGKKTDREREIEIEIEIERERE